MEVVTPGQTGASFYVRGLALVLLGLHVTMLAVMAYWDAPVSDEVGHLPAGISHWQTGNFDLYRVNPPLTRLIAAPLPILAGVDTDWSTLPIGPGDRSEFELGQKFVQVNAEKIRWIYALGRWSCIPLSILGALVCFAWGTELYGEYSGLLSLTLWCFSPTVHALGHVVIPDMAAASLGCLLFYVFWRWLKSPDALKTLAVGSVMGLALASKGTWVIIILVLFPFWWMIRFATDSTRSRERLSVQCLRVGAIVLTSLLVLNATYGFEGSFKVLGEYEFVSQELAGTRLQNANLPLSTGNRFADTWLGKVRVPLPYNYVKGIDWIKWELENGYPSYMRGQWKRGGWWYFYLYAIAVKVPLGYLGLFALAGAASIFLTPQSKLDSLNDVFLLTTPATLLIFVSCQTGFTHHLRYVFPIFPFCFVFAGKIIVYLRRHQLALPVTAGIFLAWAVIGSLLVFPHSICYFNEIAGGPSNGHHHLLTSNLDWGQDLYRVNAWVDENLDARPFFYAHANHLVDPQSMITGCQVPPTQLELSNALRNGRSIQELLQPGWYGISDGIRFRYEYLSQFAPEKCLAFVVKIYHLDRKRIEEVERKLVESDPAQDRGTLSHELP